MAWQVIVLDEVKVWLQSLDEKSLLAVLQALEILRIEGPNLGRPLVDRISGSLISNLKELRPIGGSGRQTFRLLFVFDPNRQAVILVGGDKHGNWRAWYIDAIEVAEFRYLRFLDRGE